MRKTGMSGLDVLNSSAMLTRALRLTAVAAAIGFVMTAGAARAQDDEDDDTFEEKIIRNIMGGIGGTNMEKPGIEYRERSPLVLPPKIDLPPPVSAASEVNDPSWPKDPDVQRRKAAIAANKKSKPTPWEAGQSILPSKLATGGSGVVRRADTDPGKPVGNENPSLSPSQLGFSGKLGSLFGGNAPQSVPFKGEPDRESLTQPPTGYQTPSPNFAYGTGGPVVPLGGTHIDIQSGKEVSN